MRVSVSKKKVIKATNKLIRSLNWKEPLNEIGDIFLDEIDRNFDQQGRLYAERGSWKPLAQSTRRDRIRKGYNGARPILVRTGKLRKGFDKKVTQREVEISNNVGYAKYHQSKRARSKLPRREILGFSERFKKATTVVLNNFLKKKIKASGLSN